MAIPELPASLPQALVRAAIDRPDRGVTIVQSRENVDRKTFPEILQLVQGGAGRLAAAGVGPGDRVLVSLPTSWAWFECWLGALWLGALPVALAPGSSVADLRRLGELLETLDGPRVVAGSKTAEEARRLGLLPVADSVLAVEELRRLRASPRVQLPEVDPEAVGFMQLTSGSTSASRAVMISHRAALHHMLSINVGTGSPENKPASEWIDTYVSWLPLHHDMGLVGCLLTAIVFAYDLAMMSPRRFVGDPAIWLESLGSGGQVLSTAPNFAYQLCVDRRDRVPQDLDLSGWRLAMVGAEMVQPETMVAFAAAYRDLGFDERVVAPCYGLAEATLSVALDTRGEGLRTSRAPGASLDGGERPLVACVGKPMLETEIRISRPEGAALPEGEEGEICVRSGSLFLGYYGDEQATSESLREGWLHTGDLGFMVDGELYVTGRIKELLIIRGHNIAPFEIEWSASNAAGEAGVYQCGAFSVSHGAAGEEAVVVLETASKEADALRMLEREVRLRVAHELKLTLSDVVFVRRGKIPKTTSGKVKRRRLAQLYNEGALERLATAGGSSPRLGDPQ
jgi:fatty-acyl-CoA synthase